MRKIMLGLKFNGTWRNYQKQVLDNFQEYQADGHVHLVAAPGSGKTTIGIELIARFDKPALVLVPTVTIREQWVDRIRQAFLEDENQVTSLVSQNLKDMKQITIATYQAFHSAMQQVQSQEDNGTTNDDTNVVIDSTHDMPIDENTRNRCQSTRDNGNNCL